MLNLIPHKVNFNMTYDLRAENRLKDKDSAFYGFCFWTRNNNFILGQYAT